MSDSNKKMIKVGFVVSIGGYIEVSTKEEAKMLEEKLRNNDYEEIEKRMVHTHFEADTWDESCKFNE
jgi:hypothetical protein